MLTSNSLEKSFKIETSKISELVELKFNLKITSTQKDSLTSFKEIEKFFLLLKEEKTIKIIDPTTSIEEYRYFIIGKNYGLKEKSSTILNLQIVANLEKDLDFWEKTKSIVAIFDLLKSLQEKYNNKNIFIEFSYITK